VLSGAQTVVNEIGGNASYAMGRWAQGSLTDGGQAITTLSGDGWNSYYYFVYNKLTALPATGNTTCDTGAFTKASLLSAASGTSPANLASSATGSAKLSFGATGAVINLTIQVASSLSTGTGVTTITTTSPDAMNMRGFNGGPTGIGSLYSQAIARIADGGNGKYIMPIYYVLKLDDGSYYQGSVAFSCQ
jgi:hypothetical protein